MRYIFTFIILSAGVGISSADVFNMGGTRNPVTGTWTGSASLEFVTVGDAGNTSDSGFGSVDYNYRIGKYDVTIGQYCKFLNAVAKTDTYGLYYSGMATDRSEFKITQSGSSGSYSYTISGYAQAANCPIFDVSWGDAARFCNWLQNGQPTGAQGAGTTETGAYTLNGVTNAYGLSAITRNPNATYFIPSENEWYKAAFYKGGGTVAGYWDYPTKSNADNPPRNNLPATGTNNANFWVLQGGVAVYTNPPYMLTPVGAFAASPGPYGTFDMGGDVWQWNESKKSDQSRGIRGGSWGTLYDQLASDWSYSSLDSASHDVGLGFRIASNVPEPSTISLLISAILGGSLLLHRKR